MSGRRPRACGVVARLALLAAPGAPLACSTIIELLNPTGTI